MARFSKWKLRYLFLILVYTLAWMAIFMGLSIIPCDPFSLLQAHGIWHVITADATYTIFLYHRSEKAVG